MIGFLTWVVWAASSLAIIIIINPRKKKEGYPSMAEDLTNTHH